MVNDLLELSSLEAEQVRLNPKDFNVRESMELIVKHFQKLAKDKGLEFSYDIRDTVPQWLHADFNRIRQVLGKPAQQRHPVYQSGVGCPFRWRPWATSRTPIKLTFIVTDTGVGIEPDKTGQHFRAIPS